MSDNLVDDYNAWKDERRNLSEGDETRDPLAWATSDDRGLALLDRAIAIIISMEDN